MNHLAASLTALALLASASSASAIDITKKEPASQVEFAHLIAATSADSLTFAYLPAGLCGVREGTRCVRTVNLVPPSAVGVTSPDEIAQLASGLSEFNPDATISTTILTGD